MQCQNPGEATEDADDADNAARLILRTVILGAPSRLLVSVLAEEMTDAQLEELNNKRRGRTQRVETSWPEAGETPIRDVKTERVPEQEHESDSEQKLKCIKQERMVTSSDEEVLGSDPKCGEPVSDDDDEEEFHPRARTKRRNSRIGDSDDSEEEPKTDEGEGSTDSNQEPLHRTLSSTKSLPSLTPSVRKLRRRSSRLQVSFCEGRSTDDESDLNTGREPLRRTRSATKSLPSDSPSPSARTLALRRLKDAKSKRKLSYGGEDEGAGGSNKAARFESSSNSSGTDVQSSGDDDDDGDLPDLSSDEGSWGCEEDGEADDEFDDLGDDEEESEDSADSEDASDNGSISDDFATTMAKITGNLSRNTRKYQEATERYHEASFKKSPSKCKKGKEEEKVVVHERLMRRLRRKASRNGLSDAEILDEMVLYATAKDDGCGGKCLCGKEGLKFLYFMHNKNVADPVKRTLGHKFIVGSECINAFNRAQISKGGSPLVLFDNLVRKGVTAFFRKEADSNGDYVFTIMGQNGRYISDQRDRIAESYRLPVRITKRRSDAGRETITVVNIRVRRAEQRLERDKKYKIFLRPRFTRPCDRGPYTVTFDLERAEEPGNNSTKSKDMPPSAKDFLK